MRFIKLFAMFVIYFRELPVATIYLFNLSCIFLKELILNKIVTFYDSFSRIEYR